jgi:hypothetical protein
MKLKIVHHTVLGTSGKYGARQGSGVPRPKASISNKSPGIIWYTFVYFSMRMKNVKK